MIYINKSSFTSKPLNIGPAAVVDCHLAITGPGPVTIEQLGEDLVWRSFPETLFLGSGAYVVSLRGAPTRFLIDGETTVEFKF